MSLVIGILGGMGPRATADFYSKLVSHVSASRDQDHPKVLIWANSQIPDRSEFLLGNGEDPTPAMLEGAKLLKNAGADFLTVPCNTAHAFLEEVSARADIRLVSMIQSVASELSNRYSTVKRVGLLATSGTLSSGIYQDILERRDLDVLQPNPQSQEELVMRSIALVKGGDTGTVPRSMIESAAAKLVASGAQAIIAGCTEIPLILTSEKIPVPVIDTTDVLARKALTEAQIGTI